jgi:hypothetical protein
MGNRTSDLLASRLICGFPPGGENKWVYRERSEKGKVREDCTSHMQNQLDLVDPGRTAVERCGKITGITNEGPFLKHHIINMLKFYNPVQQYKYHQSEHKNGQNKNMVSLLSRSQ